MFHKLFCLILSFFLISSIGLCNWEIKASEDKNDVGFEYAAKDGEFPIGPASFRVIGQNLWILDSIKGRVLLYGPNGNQIRSIAIPVLKKGFKLVDFALQFDDQENGRVIVAEANAKELIIISFEGYVEAVIADAAIKQIDEIETGKNGQIFIDDYLNSSTYVLSAAGCLEKILPSISTGLVIDMQNNLVAMDYDEKNGYAFLTISSDGKEISRQTIGLSELEAPRIWAVDSDGKKMVSFLLPESGEGQLVVCSSDGKILDKKAFAAPPCINRYFAFDKGTAWLMVADYYNSPDQPIKIERLPVK